MKKLIVFDLDGTLAESKSPIDGEMAALLEKELGPGLRKAHHNEGTTRSVDS